VQKGVQDAVNHAKVIMPLILAFNVDQVTIQSIEATSKEVANMHANGR
jgi:hypothetical protein